MLALIIGLVVVPLLTPGWDTSRRPDYIVLLRSDQAEVLARFQKLKDRLIDLGYQVRIQENDAATDQILYGAESCVDAVEDISGQLRPLLDLNGIEIQRFGTYEDAYRRRNIVIQIWDAARFTDSGYVSTPTGEAIEMVYVPAGDFEMGADDGQADERPIHSVALDGNWIARTEVTNRHYAAFLNQVGNQSEGGVSWLDIDDAECLIEQVEGRYQPKNGYDAHPVVEVTWHGAAAYCQWLGLDLPTEAEWEYAARGPSGNIYPWGDNRPSCGLAQSEACPGGIAPVGSAPAGASWRGALDMAGNAWEWVADWYNAGAYEDSAVQNPSGPTSGDDRGLRGGSAKDSELNLRSSQRFYTNPASADAFIGFRCINRAAGPGG